MVLPDAVVLDHLLQPLVEALGVKPLMPLALQLLLRLNNKGNVQKSCQLHIIPPLFVHAILTSTKGNRK